MSLTITSDVTYRWGNLFVLDIIQWVNQTYPIEHSVSTQPAVQPSVQPTVQPSVQPPVQPLGKIVQLDTGMPRLSAHILDHDTVIITNLDTNSIVPHNIHPDGSSQHGLRNVCKIWGIDLSEQQNSESYSFKLVRTVAGEYVTPGSIAAIGIYDCAAVYDYSCSDIYLTVSRKYDVLYNIVNLLMLNILTANRDGFYALYHLDNLLAVCHKKDTSVPKCHKGLMLPGSADSSNVLILNQGSWSIYLKLGEIA